MFKPKKLLLSIVLTITLLSGFFGFVVFAADKTLLTQAYNEVQGIITTQDNSPVGDPYYQVSSYTAFITEINNLGGLAGIQVVIDDELATDIEVETLTSSLNIAISGLILNDTYYLTLANFSQANSIDLTPYTSTSQILYNNELDRIELILNNPTAGDQVISDLNTDIDAADGLLVLRGDKTDLIASKDQVETIYISTGELYIPTTFLTFKTDYDNIDIDLQTDIGTTLTALIADIDAIQSDIDIANDKLNEILNILVLRPDKQVLTDDYNAALLIDGSTYTSSSYVVFESGLANILIVINDVEATQSDVDQAVLDLAELYNLLVSLADLNDLIGAYETALSLDTSAYTPNSIVLYQAELTRINVIINSDDTSQVIADQALIDLDEAENLLILQADRADLETLNSLIIETYYEKKAEYTETSYSAFKTVVDNYGSYNYVNSIIDNDNIDQQTVDGLVAIMESALDTLVPLEDNAEFLILYYSLKDIDLSTYTLDSRNLYNLELDRIFDVITGKEFDSSASAQITIDISNVNDLLIELPDFSGLQALYESTAIYRESDYSITSFGYLTIAQDYALDVISNLNSNEDLVNDAIDLINDAVDNLTQKAETIFVIQGNEVDINQYITLGQASITQYYTYNQDLVEISSLGTITGLKYGDAKVYIELSNGYIEILDIHVKAKVSATVYVLTFSMPVISLGFGAGVVFINKSTWKNILISVTNIFKKKIK